MKKQTNDLVVLVAQCDEITEIHRDDSSSIIELANKDNAGDGLVITYRIFPGVYLQFNDLRLDGCLAKFDAEGHFFCIDHCREGRLHSDEPKPDGYNMGAGGMVLSLTKTGEKYIEFPLGHYHGITITFNRETAMDGIREYAPHFPVEIEQVIRRFSLDDDKLPLHKMRILDSVFDDLYAVPAHIKLDYFRVKVLEIILYLSPLELPKEEGEKPYFYKTQVEKVREIHSMITNRLDQHFRLKDLSSRYNMSVPAMEKCFQNLYGNSIAKYMREYRMNQATILLRNNHEKSVLEIASEMGYNSPGKFSTAFKEVIGMSPLTYRKSFDRRMSKRMGKESSLELVEEE